MPPRQGTLDKFVKVNRLVKEPELLKEKGVLLLPPRAQPTETPAMNTPACGQKSSNAKIEDIEILLSLSNSLDSLLKRKAKLLKAKNLVQ